MTKPQGGSHQSPAAQAAKARGAAKSRSRMKESIVILKAKVEKLEHQVDEIIKRLIDRGDLL